MQWPVKSDHYGGQWVPNIFYRKLFLFKTFAFQLTFSEFFSTNACFYLSFRFISILISIFFYLNLRAWFLNKISLSEHLSWYLYKDKYEKINTWIIDMSNLQLLFDAHVNSKASFTLFIYKVWHFVDIHLMTNHCYFE